MPDWSIKIVTGKDGKTRFAPDQIGVKPGGALQAYQDDLVSWNNTTDQKHQPWPTDANYKPLPSTQVKRGNALYMSDPIPANQSSRPIYDVAQPTVAKGQTPPTQWTVYYYCKTHPNEQSERGTINAKVVPVVNIPD
jgi:hypothetical protein